MRVVLTKEAKNFLETKSENKDLEVLFAWAESLKPIEFLEVKKKPAVAGLTPRGDFYIREFPGFVAILELNVDS